MIDPNELLFEDALQGTVLLMVTKKSNAQQVSEGVAIIAAPNNDFLQTTQRRSFQRLCIYQATI